MLFKVYAACCVKPKHIAEVTEKDLREAFDEVFNRANDAGLIDIMKDDDPDEVDDWKVSDAYQKIEKYWSDNKLIECGDWMIIEANDRIEVEIPNMCGESETMIF